MLACKEGEIQDPARFSTRTLKKKTVATIEILSYRIQVLKQQDVFASFLQSISLIVSFGMYNLKGHQINN